MPIPLSAFEPIWQSQYKDRIQKRNLWFDVNQTYGTTWMVTLLQHCGNGYYNFSFHGAIYIWKECIFNIWRYLKGCPIWLLHRLRWLSFWVSHPLPSFDKPFPNCNTMINLIISEFRPIAKSRTAEGLRFRRLLPHLLRRLQEPHPAPLQAHLLRGVPGKPVNFLTYPS